MGLCVPPILTAQVEHRRLVAFSGLQLQGLVLLPQTVPTARPQAHVVLLTFQASPQECHLPLSWSVSYNEMHVQSQLLSLAFFLNQSFEMLV